jgi:hypothetical protein
MELDAADAEAALLEAVADGAVLRVPVGDDALWLPRPSAALRLVA